MVAAIRDAKYLIIYYTHTYGYETEQFLPGWRWEQDLRVRDMDGTRFAAKMR